MSLLYGQATHAGKKSPTNQDAVLTWVMQQTAQAKLPPIGLFAVCDGFGTSPHGEQAAVQVLDSLIEEVYRSVIQPLRKGQTCRDADLTDALRRGFQHAHHAILQHYPAGGVCATAALVVGMVAYIAHVGDTRCYALQPPRSRLLTDDHTMLARLIELKYVTLSESRQIPLDARLYNAVGVQSQLQIDLLKYPLKAGSGLLLCSDGFYSTFESAHSTALRSDVVQRILSNEHPQAACEDLLEVALARHGKANTSLVLVTHNFPFARR
jgi:serine/threonine protein phosphatase PrpC